jgi:hypothetical protein
VLVLTGSTAVATLSRYAFSPTRVVASVADLVEEIEALPAGNLPRRVAGPPRSLVS